MNTAKFAVRYPDWVEKNQGLLCPFLLLAYASLVFWSIIAKLGVYSTGDIASYIAAGLLWLGNVLTYGELYHPNRGFSVLCGILVSAFNHYDVFIIVAVVSFPSFLTATFFFFKTFEFMTDTKTAFWATFLVVALPTVNMPMRYALPEIPLLALYALAMYLTVSEKVGPVVIGIVIGASFWLRSQMLMFVPLWPFLFRNSSSFRHIAKNGILLALGAIPFIVAQYVVDGQVGAGGYETVGNLPMRFSLHNVLYQFERLTEYRIELAVYVIGLGSILFQGIRERYWRLWLFSAIPFFWLMVVMCYVGETLRPGVFLFMFIPFSFLSYMVLRIFCERIENVRWSHLPLYVPMIFVLLGLCSGRTSNIIRYVTEPKKVTERINAFSLDHRKLFESLPAGAVILTEGHRAAVWTQINALHAVIHILGCLPEYIFKFDNKWNTWSSAGVCGTQTNLT